MRRGVSLLRSSQWAARDALQCRSMQPRLFTSSAVLLKSTSVPVFQPTSSPELDNLLQILREKIFLPAYLSKTQKDLIFHKKNKKALDLEPVVTSIGGEEFRLRYINIMGDIPGTRQTVRRVFEHIKEDSDFEVVPKIMEGLNKTNQRGDYEDLIPGTSVGLLSRAGRQDIVLECVRQASKTGLYLNNPSRAKSVLRSMAQKALDSDWSAADTQKSLQWSFQVLDLMEDPKHAYDGDDPFLDARKRPDVIAIPLRIAAVHALKHQDGKDVDGSVGQLANRVLTHFNNLPRYQEKLAHFPPKVGRWYHVHNARLAASTILLDGMQIAQKVLGPTSETTAQLNTKSPEIAKQVEESYAAISGSQWAAAKKRGGISFYEGMVSKTL